MLGSPSHPYYPLDANVVGYEPNQTPVLELLFSAGGACTVLLSVTFALASYVRPSLRMADRIAILWFVLCKTCETKSEVLNVDEISGNSTLFL